MGVPRSPRPSEGLSEGDRADGSQGGGLPIIVLESAFPTRPRPGARGARGAHLPSKTAVSRSTVDSTTRRVRQRLSLRLPPHGSGAPETSKNTLLLKEKEARQKTSGSRRRLYANFWPARARAGCSYVRRAARGEAEPPSVHRNPFGWFAGASCWNGSTRRCLASTTSSSANSLLAHASFLDPHGDTGGGDGHEGFTGWWYCSAGSEAARDVGGGGGVVGRAARATRRHRGSEAYGAFSSAYGGDAARAGGAAGSSSVAMATAAALCRRIETCGIGAHLWLRWVRCENDGWSLPASPSASVAATPSRRAGRARHRGPRRGVPPLRRAVCGAATRRTP